LFNFKKLNAPTALFSWKTKPKGDTMDTTTTQSKIHPKISDMVAKTLRRNPSTPSQELFSKANEIDPENSSLNMRQFHGRYVLPAKRRIKNTSTDSTPAKSKTISKKRGGIRTGSVRAKNTSVPTDGHITSILNELVINTAKTLRRGGDLTEVFDSVDGYAERLTSRSSR
jgi:hypothetical protein